MSIFFSPDEPKRIDIHSGRLTRLRESPKTFSREKSVTLRERQQQASRTMRVVPECAELRSIREAYQGFVDMFAKFNRQNGPAITGAYISNNFLHFKAAFDPFLLHACHYFNSSAQAQSVRRYSPLLQFAAKLLREWAILVSRMNRFSASEVLPHLHQLQLGFESLSNDVSAISNAFVSRTYHKDTIFASSNYLKHKITSNYQEVYRFISDESGFKAKRLQHLRNQMVLLSRDVNENFLGLLPPNATATPEMTRLRSQMKASVGDIVGLVDAAFHFRRRMGVLQEQMSVLHYAICAMLDRLGIHYDIEVEPLAPNCQDTEDDATTRGGGDDVTETAEAPKTPEQRVDSFVSGVGEMLDISLDGATDTATKMDVVEQTLKNRTTTPVTPMRLAYVEIPPPIRQGKASCRRPNSARKNPLARSQPTPKCGKGGV